LRRVARQLLVLREGFERLFCVLFTKPEKYQRP